MPNPDSFPMCNIHEERIQRQEDLMQTITKSVVEQGAKAEFMSQKLDEIHIRLDAKLDDVLEQLKVVAKSAQDHDERIANLERVEQARKDKRDRLRKIVLAIVLAGAGAFGTRFVEWLFHLPKGG